MPFIVGIYRIQNIKNGKFYLGSTKHSEDRFRTHLNQLKRGDHHSVYLQRSWDKHGARCFVFGMVECCSADALRELEQEHLDEEPCHYNVSEDVCGGDLISDHPNKDQILDKRAEAQKEFYSSLSADQIRDLRGCDWRGSKNPNWKGGVVEEKTTCECGNSKVAEADRCIGCYDKTGENNPFYGKEHSEEMKQKMSERKKGEYHGNQERPVTDGEEVYKSVSEAARQYDFVPNTIINRARSDNFPNWAYLDELDGTKISE